MRTPYNNTAALHANEPGPALLYRFERFRKLQQVVNGADQAPFSLHFRNTAHQELPKASTLFDLAEDRFDYRFAQPIAAASSGSRQLRTHRRHSGACAATTLADGCCLAVTLASGGNVTVDAVTGEDGEIAFAAVSGIRGKLLSLSAHVLFDLLHHRLELLNIIAAVAQTLRDNDLSRGVHRRLRVVGLDIFLARLVHDGAFRVGEIALRLRFRGRLTGLACLHFQCFPRFADLGNSLFLVSYPLRHLVSRCSRPC